jgi:DNA repair protein RadC
LDTSLRAFTTTAILSLGYSADTTAINLQIARRSNSAISSEILSFQFSPKAHFRASGFLVLEIHMHALDPDPVQRGWPLNEQPMTRLFTFGLQALSDAELLAILLRKGSNGRSAVDLARSVLSKYGGISPLLAAADASSSLLTFEALARLRAATELVNRGLRENLQRGSALSSPNAVRDYLRLRLSRLEHEAFFVILLDAQNQVIVAEEMFRGTLTQTSVFPREIVKAALRHNAASILLAHNHPSGVAEPSHADEMLTTALKAALALVDVRVLDHFIVAGTGILSFAERGLL